MPGGSCTTSSVWRLWFDFCSDQITTSAAVVKSKDRFCVTEIPTLNGNALWFSGGSQSPFLCPTSPYLACRLGRIAAQLRQFWGSVWITQPPHQGCLSIYTTSSKALTLAFLYLLCIHHLLFSKLIFICRCLARSKEIMSKLDRWYFRSLYCRSDHFAHYNFIVIYIKK